MNKSTAIALISALVAPALADEARQTESPVRQAGPPVTDFIRVDEDASTARLQTAVTRYARDASTVALIGTIHIADKSYYEGLNKRFEAYDAVLFEMIGGADPAAREMPAADEDPDAEATLDAVRQLYAMVSRFLGLGDQLSTIDYQRKNFIHADLSVDEFVELQADRGESLLGFALEAGKSAGDRPAAKQPDMARLLQAMLTGNSNQAKLELVHTLGAGDDQIASFAGENVIIGDRNAKCLKVLGEQITAGQHKLAVFYGAAHFPDMEKRLLAGGWKRTGQEWLTAWEIPKTAKAE